MEKEVSCGKRGVVWKKRCRAEEEVSCVVEDVSCRGVMKKKRRRVKKRRRAEEEVSCRIRGVMWKERRRLEE